MDKQEWNKEPPKLLAIQSWSNQVGKTTLIEILAGGFKHFSQYLGWMFGWLPWNHQP